MLPWHGAAYLGRGGVQVGGGRKEEGFGRKGVRSCYVGMAPRSWAGAGFRGAKPITNEPGVSLEVTTSPEVRNACQRLFDLLSGPIGEFGISHITGLSVAQLKANDPVRPQSCLGTGSCYSLCVSVPAAGPGVHPQGRGALWLEVDHGAPVACQDAQLGPFPFELTTPQNTVLEPGEVAQGFFVDTWNQIVSFSMSDGRLVISQGMPAGDCVVIHMICSDDRPEIDASGKLGQHLLEAGFRWHTLQRAFGDCDAQPRAPIADDLVVARPLAAIADGPRGGCAADHGDACADEAE